MSDRTHRWQATGQLHVYADAQRPVFVCEHCGQTRHRNAAETAWVVTIGLRRVVILDRAEDLKDTPCSPFVSWTP